MPVNDIKSMLMRDEGLRLKPYPDSVGKMTIGYGRNLDDRGVSVAEADFMLDNDITAATADVLRTIPWSMSLDEVRRSVLVNMTVNMGVGGVLGFRRMLAAAERGDWATAAKEMLDSKWATQVGPRAHRLAQSMETGEWR